MLHSEHSDVKVSVITVVYNAVDKIESTVQSVLGQDYGNLEYIVVDGGSTDGTPDILNRYRDKIDVLISERDDGIYDALNKGILKATGEWIGIMNAGDVFADCNVLSKVFGGGEDYDSVDVVYGDAVSVDGNVEVFCKASESVADLEKGPCYRHGASFVRRDVHRRHLFDLSKKDLLEFALDYEQIYRMYRNGVRFLKVPVPLIKYELRGASTVSPFKITYVNYLITHNMRCGMWHMILIGVLTLERGFILLLKRLVHTAKA